MQAYWYVDLGFTEALSRRCVVPRGFRTLRVSYESYLSLGRLNGSL
jgi:hypothetical protein